MKNIELLFGWLWPRKTELNVRKWVQITYDPIHLRKQRAKEKDWCGKLQVSHTVYPTPLPLRTNPLIERVKAEKGKVKHPTSIRQTVAEIKRRDEGKHS